jgi:glycosyltransferase involved in cell wall biosynthesis
VARIVSVVSNGCVSDPRVLREAQWLFDAGHEVTIHAFDRLENLPLESNYNGIKIIRHRVGITPYGGTWSTWRGLQRFRKSVVNGVNEIDLLHCHDADTLLLAKKINTKRVLFDMHDLHHTWVMMRNPKSLFRHLISNQMKTRMLRQTALADSIITSSPFFCDWLSDRGIKSYPVENRIAIQELFPKPSEFTIGYFGKIREEAAFELLFEAIQTLRKNDRPKVRIAGDGVSRQKVIEMIERYPDLDIVIQDAFEHSDLPSMMRGISVMFAMYPPQRGNIREGAIPSKMFEAAAFGRPCIVNKGVPMGTICETESLGRTVSWGDVVELADAILHLKDVNVELQSDAKREEERFLQIIDDLKI